MCIYTYTCIYTEQSTETGPRRTFVLLRESRRFAKASYIVNRACERACSLSLCLPRSLRPDDFLRLRLSGAPSPGLSLNDRAANYVNEKERRASR